jgi:PLP dependent protein
MIDQDQINKNYQAVLGQISAAAERSGRSNQDVRLVVVTKGHPVAAIQAVIAAGAQMLGENYVEAATAKIDQLKGSLGISVIGPRFGGVSVRTHAHTPKSGVSPQEFPETQLKSFFGVEWHMIGHIQSRKARAVCEYFNYVHSLDSLKLAGRLDRFAGELDISLPVLLECNVSGEDTKYGFSVWRESDLPAFFTVVSEIISLPHLEVHGLMTMAPFFEDPENARPYFKQLKSLQNRLSQQFPGTDWRELSMGMSGDFQVAIEEGATLVRIGTAIMGSRPQA